MRKEITLVAFDADDTLWVNEPFYEDASKKLEEIIKQYTDIQSISDILYKTQLKNLSLFGYGAKGFTISMIETAIELTDENISAPEIQDIINIGKSMINNPIELLPHVEKIIKNLSQQIDLMIVTKGELFDQESKIARSGLSDFFKYIEIVSEKDDETYMNILQNHNTAPENFLMIGNSPRSDILPVVNIGAHAIHIPYDTTWIHEHVSDHDVYEKYEELESIEFLPDVLKEKFYLPLA